MNKEELKTNISDFLSGKLDADRNERMKMFYGEGFSKENVYTPKPNSIDDYIKQFRFYTGNAEYVELNLEPSEKNLISFKASLIDDIEYEDCRMFMDGEPQVMRIFTIESKDGIRFFTDEASYNSFNEPVEHTKDDFLKLLDNQPSLKNNNYVKYMKATILHNELQEDLINKAELVNKKHKI
jgi:hypothetical protein